MSTSRKDELIKDALRNCDIKSQHELNPCNDGKRSSDVLVEAISKLETITKENEFFKEIIKDEMIKNGERLEEIERLQKQLNIAVKRLEFLKNKTSSPHYGNDTYLKTICQMCDKTLRQIEDLNK